ncbi:MAG: DUF1467 family protein [Pseudomonadota bacterium]
MWANIDWLGALVVLVLIWWVVLFMVLPWGAASYHERGEEVAPGHAPSAPLAPRLKKKALVTTAIALVLWLAYVGLFETGFIHLAFLEAGG